MNEVRVAPDLSHANTKTTADGIAASKKPVLITHAGCRAVYMHPRNKEDRELKALADKGGVVGIYMLPFLTAPPKQPMLKDFLQHLNHAVKVCGEDHVGIGTDVPFLDVGEEELAELKAQERGTESRGDRCARRGSAGLHPGPEYRTRKLERRPMRCRSAATRSAAVRKSWWQISSGSWPTSGLRNYSGTVCPEPPISARKILWLEQIVLNRQMV